jgi:hypothetical protein
MFRDRSRKTYKDGELDARGEILGKSLHLWPEHGRPATGIAVAMGRPLTMGGGPSPVDLTPRPRQFSAQGIHFMAN